MKTLVKKIFHNWGLKLASLLLAFVLWFLVAQVGDPQDVTYFSNIPVKLVNTALLENENKVYEILDGSDQVRVTVRAPRSVIKELRSSDILAEADVSKLTDINTIAISFSVQNLNSDSIQSIKGDHDVVKLAVEEKLSKWIRIQYRTTGEVAEGYMVASATSDQNMIEVTGPKSVIERVNYAAVTVDVTGATTRMTLNAETELFDKDGEKVESAGIRKNADYVLMSVEVLAVKEVPIELRVMGVPADGYLATGEVKCEPSTVKIAGSAMMLSNISKIVIPEEALNITGESSTMETTITLKDYINDNIRFADSSFNGRVKATVYIEPKVQKDLQISQDKIRIINIPENFRTELPEAEEPYKLTIAGLNAAVSAVNLEDIQGVIDLKAWMESEGIEELDNGVYSIPVKFNLTDEVTQENEIILKITIMKLEDM